MAFAESFRENQFHGPPTTAARRPRAELLIISRKAVGFVVPLRVDFTWVS
jgi:hypothetical protein